MLSGYTPLAQPRSVCLLILFCFCLFVLFFLFLFSSFREWQILWTTCLKGDGNHAREKSELLSFSLGSAQRNIIPSLVFLSRGVEQSRESSPGEPFPSLCALPLDGRGPGGEARPLPTSIWDQPWPWAGVKQPKQHPVLEMDRWRIWSFVGSPWRIERIWVPNRRRHMS